MLVKLWPYRMHISDFLARIVFGCHLALDMYLWEQRFPETPKHVIGDLSIGSSSGRGDHHRFEKAALAGNRGKRWGRRTKAVLKKEKSHRGKIAAAEWRLLMKYNLAVNRTFANHGALHIAADASRIGLKEVLVVFLYHPASGYCAWGPPQEHHRRCHRL